MTNDKHDNFFSLIQESNDPNTSAERLKEIAKILMTYKNYIGKLKHAHQDDD